MVSTAFSPAKPEEAFTPGVNMKSPMSSFFSPKNAPSIKFKVPKLKKLIKSGNKTFAKRNKKINDILNLPLPPKEDLLKDNFFSDTNIDIDSPLSGQKEENA